MTQGNEALLAIEGFQRWHVRCCDDVDLARARLLLPIPLADRADKVNKRRPNGTSVPSENPSELVSLEEIDRRYVTRVLASVGGNKSAAARILVVERKTLYRMIERWGLDPK